MADLAKNTNLLSSRKWSTIGEKRPNVSQGLVIRNGGRKVDQGGVIEIKTRPAREPLYLRDVLSQLWMSQTPNLIVAYHDGGYFSYVRVLDVREDLKKWEKWNSMSLQKLNTLIRRIIEAVKSTITMKCRVMMTESGRLEIQELDFSHQSSLPDDLCHKFKKKDPEIKKELQMLKSQDDDGS